MVISWPDHHIYVKKPYSVHPKFSTHTKSQKIEFWITRHFFSGGGGRGSQAGLITFILHYKSVEMSSSKYTSNQPRIRLIRFWLEVSCIVARNDDFWIPPSSGIIWKPSILKLAQGKLIACIYLIGYCIFAAICSLLYTAQKTFQEISLILFHKKIPSVVLHRLAM